MTRRLLAAFVGLTLIVLLVHDIPMSQHLRSVERDRTITAMERDAFTMAGLAEESIERASGGARNDLAYLRKLAATYAASTKSAVTVYDLNGTVIATSRATTTKTSTKTPQRTQAATLALRGIRTSGTRSDAESGGEVVYVAVPILTGPTAIGAIEFVRSAAEVRRRANARLLGLAIAAGISLMLAAAIGWLLARTLTRPVRQLRQTTKSIAAGALDTRADVASAPREIADLATDFNSMVEQLQRVLEQQREFAADVSHQLRTPLTTVRLRLEHLSTMVQEGSQEQESLVAARNELHRLGRTVEGLLAIARADTHAAPLGVVDVTAVMNERCRSWEPLVQEAGVEFACEIEPRLIATAIAGTLDEIIDNFIDNALEGGAALHNIKVVARREGDTIVCRVVDDGPGLDDDGLVRAFDRFWRADPNRPGGHGVGLAVVERLAHASRGAAVLRHSGSGPHTGITAEVRLPAARFDERQG